MRPARRRCIGRKTQGGRFDLVQNIILPKQGLQMTEGFITRWLLKEGDTVKEGEPLFEMETDKLVITIDATCSGKLLKILYPEGSTVPITTVIAYVGEDGDEVPEGVPASVAEVPAPAAPEPLPAAREAAVPAPAEAPVSVPACCADGRLFATPRARLRAAEQGYDLHEIVPSGPDGLIVERDVLSFTPATGSGGAELFSGALPCILSARVSLFSGEEMSPEAVLRLAYGKAAETTGISCGAEPAVHISENSALTMCLLPSAAPRITVCDGNVTLAFYPEADADEETLLRFFALFCLFAEKPWLAAVR